MQKIKPKDHDIEMNQEARSATVPMPEQAFFQIKGMSCAACQAAIERAVGKLEGVLSVEVQLLQEKMKVSFDPSLCDSQTILGAVAAAGYKAVWLEKRGSGSAVERAPATSSAKKERMAWEDDREEQRLAARKRLITSLLLLIPLMALSMGPMIGLPLPDFLSGDKGAAGLALSQMLIALTISVIQRQFYISGFNALRHGRPNMDSLIAVGAAAALLYGIFAVYRIQYGMGTGQWHLVHDYAHKLYFESAAMILSLISLGKYLEQMAKGKTSQAISRLLDLAPETARRLTASGEREEVAVEELLPGDFIELRAGERIAVDGIVREGRSAVDESSLTGESLPVEKTVGDRLYAASINKSATLIFEATRVGEDTSLAQIIRLVSDAASSKAPSARLADRIAGFFVPLVLLIALITMTAWLLSGHSFEMAMNMAVSVLVVSCPCALGLATPAAVMAGIGKGAELGILIKSGEALETAQKINAVVLDKTGTVTEGRPSIRKILPAKGVTEAELLQLAVNLEASANHPLAEAVLRKAQEARIFATTNILSENLAGFGLRADLDGETFYAGSLRLLREKGGGGVELEERKRLEEEGLELASGGMSLLYFFSASRYYGALAAMDAIKAGSAAAVRAMTEMGLRVYLLSGDQKQAAFACGRELALPEEQIWAEVLPVEKAEKIRELKAAGYCAAMVGDGINDAPALALADLGVAIGQGTDVAIESADLILMRSDLRDVLSALMLSRATLRTIKENLFWAFFYNVLGIPLAAGVFYSALGLSLNPMIAAAAMSFSSIFVVGNALRLRRFRSMSPESGLSEYVQTHEPRGMSKANEESQTADHEQIDPINKLERKVENMLTSQRCLKIDGMSCKHCQRHVEEALNALEGVKAEVFLEEKEARLELRKEISDEVLRRAVEDAGYKLLSITKG